MAAERRGNDFYVSNREPLTESPLVKLPIDAIEHGGWLRHQLELEADGMVGHLHEFSKWCKFEGSAWVGKNGEGEFGWETTDNEGKARTIRFNSGKDSVIEECERSLKRLFDKHQGRSGVPPVPLASG